MALAILITTLGLIVAFVVACILEKSPVTGSIGARFSVGISERAPVEFEPGFGNDKFEAQRQAADGWLTRQELAIEKRGLEMQFVCALSKALTAASKLSMPSKHTVARQVAPIPTLVLVAATVLFSRTARISGSVAGSLAINKERGPPYRLWARGIQGERCV